MMKGNNKLELSQKFSLPQIEIRLFFLQPVVHGPKVPRPMKCTLYLIPLPPTQPPPKHPQMQPYSRDGGTRRCFYEFQTFMACYTSAETSTSKQCTPQFDDYYECIHGFKEREKARLMVKQLKANEASGEGVKALDLYKKSGAVYENLELVK
ncbi:hypothetical protein PUMCH_002672 [Australozyma saopauloensis]|uniref:NADH dehydrogenase [ubiquinone] iron-sulfur protein 5 n=1 Tax=Australozyma saopauloensis TaxID=291208 RepID=A0AAX4H9Y7_9ASCO|nr:hypothetical protein PUMCH_002672 [[Candida] saopauloensis]